MRKKALLGSIAKSTAKTVGKYELANATGGISEFVTGRSKLKAGVDTASQLNANKNMAEAESSGQGLKERNRPSRPPKTASLSSKVHQTYEDMMYLEKRASGLDLGSIGKVTLYGAGTALGGMAIAGAAHGASKLHSKLKTENVWNQLKKRHPDLTRTQQDRENFEVLQQFSPSLASNITTARSYMQRAQYTNMTPHEFVGDLAKTENTMRGMGLGSQVQDITSHSINTGINYQNMVTNEKRASLIAKMDEIYDL